jgi:hypothetical protein
MRTPIIHTATAITIRTAYHTDVSRTTLRIHTSTHSPTSSTSSPPPVTSSPPPIPPTLPLSHYLPPGHTRKGRLSLGQNPVHTYVGLHNKTQANASTSQTPKRAPKWPQKQKAKAPSTPASKASRSPARSEPTSFSTPSSSTPRENDSKPYRPAAYTLFLEAALRSGVPGG